MTDLDKEAWSLVGDGYLCEKKSAYLIGAKKNKFWLEATFDETTDEFVLTSTIQLELSESLPVEMTYVDVELCWDLAADLTQCHFVEAIWNELQGYKLTEKIYTFDHKPLPTDLYEVDRLGYSVFVYPNATVTFSVSQGDINEHKKMTDPSI